MKHIVSIMSSSSQNDCEISAQIRGKSLQLSQYGADFDPATMEALLRNFDGKCDVMALSGFHPPVRIGRKVYFHNDTQRLIQVSKQTIVVTGDIFRDTYTPWALRNLFKENPNFAHCRFGFLSGISQQKLAQTVAEFTDRIYFADPFLQFGLPIALKGINEFATYAKWALPLLRRKKFKNIRSDFDFEQLLSSRAFRSFKRSDVIIATSTLLERTDLSILKEKILILDFLSPALEYRLKLAGVSTVISLSPNIGSVGTESALNFAVLEAILQIEKTDDERVGQDDVLDFISDLDLKPQSQILNAPAAKSIQRFAFIVHPLSLQYLFLHPLLKPLSHVPSGALGLLESAVGKLPGVRYGSITGIKSESSGQEVEGIIYTIFDTPRQLLKQSPEEVYDKLVKVAEKAMRDGAKIIGLGAFTKIVGDGGVSVANRSPIPVTTGNSLSAAATLWAAREACEKMGFVPEFKRGEVIDATVMVLGAAGSIGAVSAKLLATVFWHVVIVGPRGDKLLDLKQDILKIAPNAKVSVATDATNLLPQCELIVVATSSVDGNVLNLGAVKPGAIICDVGRPVSFSASEAITRPDVLIIESGEVLLPGDVKISCDLGLEESVVYACLAETALLAMEGKFESFTLSRNIDFRKVGQIYDMARKHGAKLAQIRGPLGIITDHEIALCREHALKKRSERIV